MKNLSSLSIFIILLGLSGFAQNYQITDFKADSLTTWQIWATGEISSSVDIDDKPGDDNTIIKNKLTPIIYYHFKEYKPQSIQYLYLRSQYQFDNYSRDNTTSDGSFTEKLNRNRKSNRINLSGKYNYTKYLSRKIGVFASTDVSIHYLDRYYKSNHKEINSIDIAKTENDGINYRITLNPGILSGRIYNASYSAKAMEIINGLRKEGLLKRELNNDEYLKLSQIILERKARYHYDSRIKKMEALKNILYFLRSIDVLAEDEILSSLITGDIYSYDIKFRAEYPDIRKTFDFMPSPRNFGQKFYLSGIVDYSNNYIEHRSLFKRKPFSSNLDSYQLGHIDKYKKETTQKIWHRGIKTGFLFSRVVNWNFFYNLNYQSQYKLIRPDYHHIKFSTIEEYNPPGLEKTDTTEQDSESRISEFFTGFNADFYFQFNTRSLLNLSGNLSYAYRSDKDWEHDVEDYHLSVKPTYIYYITPKFHFSGGLEIIFDKFWNGPGSSEVRKDIRFNLATKYYL